MGTSTEEFEKHSIHFPESKMYTVDLTGSFAGMVPASIPVEQSVYWAAVAFYRNAFSVTEQDGGVYSSAYGFKFSVEAAASAGGSIRLHLSSASDRQEVATKLATGQVTYGNGLITVTDPYEITWSIA